jgi:hypothetical protein
MRRLYGVALARPGAVRHPLPRTRRPSLTDSAQIVVRLWVRLRSFRSSLVRFAQDSDDCRDRKHE